MSTADLIARRLQPTIGAEIGTWTSARGDINRARSC
jgi:hypothetical protein